MKINETLIDLGLSSLEASAYLALLKLGGSTASSAAKEIGLKRTTVYPILKELASKGFVEVYLRKSKQYYYAQKPDRISDTFKNKLDAFNSAIPLIEALDKKQAKIFGLRFIETREELKSFYFGILEEYKNKKYYVIGNAGAWEALDTDFFIQYRKDRANQNIKTQILLSSDSKTTNPTDNKLLREFKYLPEKYKFKSTIDIYKDKILVVSPNISSLAVVIAIPAMVDVFKSMFEMLWEKSE
jgi:sugar-specific transcriptional regulator TrmB